MLFHITLIIYPIQAEDSMKAEKQSYLQNHIMHLELRELLMDHNIASQEMAPNSQEMQVIYKREQFVAHVTHSHKTGNKYYFT